MPDDRPLSKDLPVGTKLRHRNGRVVTLGAHARTGDRRATYWVVEPRDPGFVWDNDIDAPDSPWSILPSDEPPAEQRCDCTDPPHRTGIVCPVHGLRGVGVSHPMSDPFAPPGSVEGEPPVESGWLARRSEVEALADALAPHMDAEEALSVAEWIVQNPEAAEQAAFDHYLAKDGTQRPDVDALRAERSPTRGDPAALENFRRSVALADDLHASRVEVPTARAWEVVDELDALLDHLSRLEAVAEAARALDVAQIQTERESAMDDDFEVLYEAWATLRAALTALDTSVVVPEGASGG